MEKSVVANGGASGASASAGGNFSIEGTIGQPAAGNQQQSLSFNFRPGFWTAAPLVPTAADVNLGGRVVAPSGRGITGASISITLPNGETRSAVSNSFGYYRFAAIMVGQAYVLTVSAKRFTFNNPTQIVVLTDERDDVDFFAVKTRSR